MRAGNAPFPITKVENMSRYFNRLMLHFFALGIASGIPFYLVLSTLSFWLTESNISPSIIGMFVWVTLPYSLKFLLSPWIDRLGLKYKKDPIRAFKIWGIVSLIGVMGATYTISQLTPQNNIIEMAITSFLISLFAASLDIVIDTIRIEMSGENPLNGFAVALESVGFRLGMLIGGAGALYLADRFDWQMAYTLMSCVLCFAIPALWFIPHKKHTYQTERKQLDYFANNTFHSYFQTSFTELKTHSPIYFLLALIFIFKLPDTVLHSMSAPFLYSIGFNKIEFANVTKTFGIPMTVIGSMAAGHLIFHLGHRLVAALVIMLQAISCLLFWLQYHIGHDLFALYITIGIESFSSGMTTTTFIALISAYCKSPFSAGHFTFMQAIGYLGRILFAMLAGAIAQYLGWGTLFILTAFTMLPAFSCLIKLRQYAAEHRKKLLEEQTHTYKNYA